MDNDGYVDAVNVIHQGTDEAAGGKETDIWSHRWSLVALNLVEIATMVHTRQTIETQKEIM